jgi:hypothetical protein
MVIPIIGQTVSKEKHEKLKEVVTLLATKNQELTVENQRLTKEVMSATRIIWAAANMQKEGKLRIPNLFMEEASSPQAYIEPSYDKEFMETVIEACIAPLIKS